MANNYTTENRCINGNDNEMYKDSNGSPETKQTSNNCYFEVNFGEDYDSCEEINTFYTCRY